MILTKEQIDEMQKLAKPLVKFLNDNCHPHVQIIVEPDSVHLYEGVAGSPITEFIKD